MENKIQTQENIINNNNNVKLQSNEIPDQRWFTYIMINQSRLHNYITVYTAYAHQQIAIENNLNVVLEKIADIESTLWWIFPCFAAINSTHSKLQTHRDTLISRFNCIDNKQKKILVKIKDITAKLKIKCGLIDQYDNPLLMQDDIDNDGQ